MNYSKGGPPFCTGPWVNRLACLITLICIGVIRHEVDAADCLPPPSGLVSWWPGEGNANDIISSNNGVLIGNVAFAPGKVGSAFALNGTNSYVRVPHSSSLDFTNGLTVEFWFENLRTDNYVY